jgi:hypothetical protein
VAWAVGRWTRLPAPDFSEPQLLIVILLSPKEENAQSCPIKTDIWTRSFRIINRLPYAIKNILTPMLERAREAVFVRFDLWYQLYSGGHKSTFWGVLHPNTGFAQRSFGGISFENLP